MTGYEVASFDDAATYLQDPAKSAVGLSLQRVPESRVGKNRVHLDLSTDDLASQVDRISGLGATVVRRFDEYGWVVLADTDGNQFCVIAA